MKGVEKTKVHMHDRMILVVYTNQNSQLSQPTSMVKTTYYARLFQQFSFAEKFRLLRMVTMTIVISYNHLK